VNNLQISISEPTSIPERPGDKANKLNLLLKSNPSICSNSTLASLFGSSITTLSPYNITLPPTRRDLSLLKVFSTTVKLTGTSFVPILPHIPSSLATLMIHLLLLLSLLILCHSVWIFLFPLPTRAYFREISQDHTALR